MLICNKYTCKMLIAYHIILIKKETAVLEDLRCCVV